MKTRLVALSAIAVMALAGCVPTPGGPGSPTTPGAPATSDPGETLGPAEPTTPAPPPPKEPTSTVSQFKITYGWAVPSSQASIKNPTKVPIGGPSEPPLPYLVGIYVGDHPQENPRFQRISFYFRGDFPSYNVAYVAEVTSEGQGSKVPLTGNAFLRVGFTEAQAHDNNGASTIKAKPTNPIGFTNLKSYGFAGDFEGHVTYGLGLQVAPGSDQVLKIRTGQLKRDAFYVVFVDVQTG